MKLNAAQLLVQKIRLAHVYQWQKNFQLSDVILQHAGKNYFDQGNYAKALAAFEKALHIRINKGSSAELLDSTRKSIDETQSRIK